MGEFPKGHQSSMTSVVIDTHVLICSVDDPEQLSLKAGDALKRSISTSSPIHVSVNSLVELAYLVEKSRIPEHTFTKAPKTIRSEKTNLQLSPIDEAVALRVRQIPRSIVPDMPDRIIAATALLLGLPLVTRDREIRGCGIATIW